jgi:RNA polymerase sigma-70 factor (ECF subfamily)
MKSVEQIWHAYHSGLLSFIRYRVGDAALAEDLLQDVFLKIHSRLDTLNEAEHLQSWLYRIARNTIIDHYRTYQSAEPLPDDLPQELDQEDERWRELGNCVRPMIELLPESYRQAVLLSEIHGLPLKEVAVQLDLSLPGAKSRVQRGRVKLKAIFLECCQFEFDCRGKPIDWAPKNGCGRTSC